MKRWLKLTPLLIFTVIAIFLFKGLFLDPKNLPSNFLDKPVPDFTLSNLDKGIPTLTRQNLLGEIALLNVWATWCIACRDDHAFLMELAAQGFPIYGLDYKDDKASALEWLQALGNPYRAIGYDKTGSVAIDFGVYGTPESFLIDKKGVIRYRHVGILNQQTWEAYFMPVIKQLTAES